MLAIYTSWSINHGYCYEVFRMVLDWCLNKPLIVVDRAHGIGGLERIGLKYQYQRLGLRNVVERFSDT
jgi:hypothetical protein